MCQTIATAKIKMCKCETLPSFSDDVISCGMSVLDSKHLRLSSLAVCSSVLYACSLNRNVSFSLHSTTLCFKALADLLPHLLDLNLAKLDHETLAHHYKNNGPCL